MKKRYKIAQHIAAGLLLCVAAACTGNFEEYNKNPYEPDAKDMEIDLYSTRSLVLNLQDLMMPEHENFSQFVDCLMPGGFSGYVADSNLGTGWSGRFATYNPADNWNRVPFNDFYSKFYPDYFQLKNQSTDEFFLALADLYRIAVMLRVTDTYGPIPYSAVGVENAIRSAYDSQRDIYLRMFSDLDAVIATLDKYAYRNFSPGADKIYGGKTLAWCKFANSLKLRMAMRVVYADEALAKQKAEEAVNSQHGVMTAAADGAYRTVASHNPWQRFMVAWNDARISADLTTYMNAYEDPRREAYYEKSTFNTKGVANGGYSGTEEYVGLRRGILQGRYNAWSHGFSAMKVNTATRIVVFRASEVTFLRAEGALRGWSMKGTAAELYAEAVRTSFEENGAKGADAYLQGTGKVSTYMDPLKGENGQQYDYSGSIDTDVTVAWAEGDFEKSLERIITQKWIANFPNCMEAWSELRRTGYPKLMAMAANASGGVVDDAEGARRLAYPTDEYRENKENVEKAVATLLQESAAKKGDTMATHLWWDCKK